MGIIATVVKTVTGDEDASPGIIKFRQSMCNACEFRKNGFCGTPIIGNIVQYKGRAVHLCGCNTNEKTTLKNQQCPANKW